MTSLWIRGTCPRCGRLGEVRVSASPELKRCRACAAEDKAVVERIVVAVVTSILAPKKKVVKRGRPRGVKSEDLGREAGPVRKAKKKGKV